MHTVNLEWRAKCYLREDSAYTMPVLLHSLFFVLNGRELATESSEYTVARTLTI